MKFGENDNTMTMNDYFTKKQMPNSFMKQKFLLIGVFLILVGNIVKLEAQPQCDGVSTLTFDSLELVNLYNDLDGGNWTNNTGWLVAPVNEWYGVHLFYQGPTGSCGVQKVELPNNNLSGELLNYDFSYLFKLDLSQNNITGTIPNFNDLPNLYSLNLSDNQLSGTIPNFQTIPLLNNLDLSANQLTGQIPNFTKLPKLNSLNLNSNNLSGNIPNFSSLEWLQWLYLQDNELSGSIPNFDKLTAVEEIDFSGNELSGSIPNFDFLTSLGSLKLNNNLLSGNVPLFDKIGVWDLEAKNNLLSGNLPSFSYFRRLKLDSNNLTGVIPDFQDMPNLIHLSLSHNSLSGSIPDFFNTPKLKYLYLTNNELSGNIPDFSNLFQLEKLDFSFNQLSGNIPNFSQLGRIEELCLANNQLSGIIPDFSIYWLKTLDLRDNQLTGSIPEFSQSWNIVSIYLGGNQLSGYLPTFSKLYDLAVIWACPNNLIGTIPEFNFSFDYEASHLDCIQSATITGTVFHDQNNNCLQDEGELIMPNTKITVNDSIFHTFSDENGFYSLDIDTGTYTIKATPSNLLWGINCPENAEPYTISLQNYDEIISNKDFGLEVEDECTLLSIDVATPRLRRCFTNIYSIFYCNEGTKSADSAYVELTFPPEIIPLSASIPFTQDGNVLSFDLDTLAIGECGYFTVTDSIGCESILGSTACVEGRIYPAFLCREVSEQWDGSEIVVEGECIDNAYIEFTITNIGEDMQDSLEYRIYEDDILSSLDKLKLIGGESEELEVTATGGTYRLKVNQADFYPWESIPQAVVELCGEEPFSLGFVTSQPNSDLEHFIDIDCQTIVGSYDPNDKAVHPQGIANQHYIEEGTELTYKIRFQNTGNDVAFRVTIVDTIQSDFLDLQSFKILSTSHSYDARIEDKNVLIVEFNDIMLPDSTSNEPESHGFVQYRINSFADAPKRSVITNTGDIYFDYNQPITTNTVFNTVGIPQLDVTLPIQLLQFDAYLDENQHTQLTWITASEINNSHFDLQRSSNNGKYFEAIGRIGGKGNSQVLNRYQFEDIDLPANTSIVYYRLKQTDFNGKFTYSNVLSLQLSQNPTTQIWYNSLQNNLEVTTQEPQKLQLYDVLGCLVKSVNLLGGRQTIHIGDLVNGTYMYQLEEGYNGKLMVVRK